VPSTSDDAEAGLLSPPDDSSDLQYKAKSPMIRKAVNQNYALRSYDYILQLTELLFISRYDDKVRIEAYPSSSCILN
jgi:hypothetical protein